MATNHYCDSTSVTGTNDICWQVWTTINCTTTVGATWTQWAGTDSGTTSSTVWRYWINDIVWSPAAETEEEMRERERKREGLERERKEDEERAKELLVSELTPEQKRELEERQEITVKSQTEKLYVIKRGRAGNVYRMRDGNPVERYCIHPVDGVPDWDAMLAQMLWLQFCEEEFLKTANVTRLYQNLPVQEAEVLAA